MELLEMVEALCGTPDGLEGGWGPWIACFVELAQAAQRPAAAHALRTGRMTGYEITAEHDALLIINDRVEIAALSAADGLHLGQRDILPTAARQLLGAESRSERAFDDVGHLVPVRSRASAGLTPTNGMPSSGVFRLATKVEIVSVSGPCSRRARHVSMSSSTSSSVSVGAPTI